MKQRTSRRRSEASKPPYGACARWLRKSLWPSPKTSSVLTPYPHQHALFSSGPQGCHNSPQRGSSDLCRGLCPRRPATSVQQGRPSARRQRKGAGRPVGSRPWRCGLAAHRRCALQLMSISPCFPRVARQRAICFPRRPDCLAATHDAGTGNRLMALTYRNKERKRALLQQWAIAQDRIGIMARAFWFRRDHLYDEKPAAHTLTSLCPVAPAGFARALGAGRHEGSPRRRGHRRGAHCEGRGRSRVRATAGRSSAAAAPLCAAGPACCGCLSRGTACGAAAGKATTAAAATVAEGRGRDAFA